MEEQETPTQAPVVNEHFEKLLKEKKNAMEALERKTKEIDDLTIKLRMMEETKLVETNNYKELYAREQAEKEKYKSDFTGLKDKHENGIKLGALRNELTKQGVKPEKVDLIFRLVDTKKLKYDQDHQVVLGVDEEARQIKSQMPEFFGRDIPGMSHDQPTQPALDVDFDDLKPEQKTKEAIIEFGKKHGIIFTDK